MKKYKVPVSWLFVLGTKQYNHQIFFFNTNELYLIRLFFISLSLQVSHEMFYFVPLTSYTKIHLHDSCIRTLCLNMLPFLLRFGMSPELNFVRCVSLGILFSDLLSYSSDERSLLLWVTPTSSLCFLTVLCSNLFICLSLISQNTKYLSDT